MMPPRLLATFVLENIEEDTRLSWNPGQLTVGFPRREPRQIHVAAIHAMPAPPPYNAQPQGHVVPPPRYPGMNQAPPPQQQPAPANPVRDNANAGENGKRRVRAPANIPRQPRVADPNSIFIYCRQPASKHGKLIIHGEHVYWQLTKSRHRVEFAVNNQASAQVMRSPNGWRIHCGMPLTGHPPGKEQSEYLALTAPKPQAFSGKVWGMWDQGKAEHNRRTWDEFLVALGSVVRVVHAGEDGRS